MDEGQQQTILRAIAVSSLNLYPQEQANALKVLEEFKKFNGRIPLCIAWLHQERHVYGGSEDITVPTKLYVLEVLHKFLQTGGYTQCSPEDRLTLRQAVLTAAKQYAPCSPSDVSTKIMGNKLASLLAGLLVRDFPQRWTTFVQDVLSPTRQGGLWYNEPGAEAVHHTGVRMCLECFKLVAEDCTDSDFNAKISTTRRNDILIGLNEVSSQFLPLFFGLLEHCTILSQSKTTLHNMRTYLLNNNKSSRDMSPEEAGAYQTQLNLQTQTGRLIADTLTAMKYFCRSMPLDWMLSSTDGNTSVQPDGSNTGSNNNLDFVAALFHLLREREANIQVLAAECLEQLCLRGKLDFLQWMRFISDLPNAISEANRVMQVECNEHLAVEIAVQTGSPVAATNPIDALTLQLEFHRALSRLLALMLSSYLPHLNNDKQILGGSGPRFEKVSAYFQLVVGMLRHPSGRVGSEQVNTWIALNRDPQIVKAKILRPFAQEVLSCYMDQMVRVRWEDVENQVHPQTALMEASWDDYNEYDSWICDLRSKTSLLFKYLGNNEPQIASATMNSRIKSLLLTHGNGEPLNNLDPSNNQLTPKSDAVMMFEGAFQPLDNVLSGMPVWALEDGTGQSDPERAAIRASTRASLAELAQALVSWNPTYLWLKFRRATLLDALKHYWKYDPSTLLQAIDSLLRYLGDPDDWRTGPSSGAAGAQKKFSDEVIGLKKKSGVSLVSISKKVPQHLVPWLTQLSEATRSLLSSEMLLALNQMHLYEFLSCVATAVDDPIKRSSFIADVLAASVNTLESPDVQQTISNVHNFLSSMGVINAGQYPESVTDTTTVKRVTAAYITLFTAVNQLMSVGKRCNEAARKRNVNLGAAPPPGVAIDNPLSFPDEGPVSLRDLAVHDPFAPLWPRFLPAVLKLMGVIMSVWHPEQQAVLLQNNIQRYAYAISDDEAFLSKNHDKNSGGVFGEGGTAGSVVAGTDRRDDNLVPKWSGWFNELRHTCFQLMGLMAGERVLFAPEMAQIYPQLVAVATNPLNLKSMEHRHVTLFLRHFIEILLITCPATLYATHLEPIVAPVFEHLQHRLEKTWAPLLSGEVNQASTKALFSADGPAAASVAARGDDQWFTGYYARAGLFVGDLDSVTAEAAVEKGRVEVTRTFGDMLQTALALKGDWALVLATQAKEEQSHRSKDDGKISLRGGGLGGPVNADGTPRGPAQSAVDARKLLRISSLCHFMFLENERIAGSLTVTVIQCMGYPDAYTCRRVTRICHRILETVAWAPQYTQLLGNRMFTEAVKNVVTEPKWMVGIEWDMINVIRDIYCRLVLGQALLPGGQGPGLQQPTQLQNPSEYEQAKTVDKPLQGGGILTSPSNLPRHVLASLPGIDMNAIDALDKSMKENRSAKAQKDAMRDLLRVAADNLKELDESRGANGGSGSAAAGLFDRAVVEESLLHHQGRNSTVVQDLPEKLVTQSMINKHNRSSEEGPQGLALFQL